MRDKENRQNNLFKLRKKHTEELLPCLWIRFLFEGKEVIKRTTAWEMLVICVSSLCSDRVITWQMVITAEPSRTRSSPICSASFSDSCWVPPCGMNRALHSGSSQKHKNNSTFTYCFEKQMFVLYHDSQSFSWQSDFEMT